MELLSDITSRHISKIGNSTTNEYEIPDDESGLNYLLFYLS